VKKKTDWRFGWNCRPCYTDDTK